MKLSHKQLRLGFFTLKRNIENAVCCFDYGSAERCEVARWNGDEFKVGLMEVADRRDALRVASRLQESLAVPVEIDGQRFAVKPKVGVSLYPHDAQDTETLLETADLALSLARKQPAPQFPADVWPEREPQA